jgi:hypothetical protein
MSEIENIDQLPRSKMDNCCRSTMAASGMMAGITIILGLQFPFLFPKSAPYMATPGSKIRRALQFLNKVTTTGSQGKGRGVGGKDPPPPVFVDLGSGDGQAVYEAARLGYHAVGIEFNWTLWAISLIRRQMFWTTQEKSHSTFLRQDFHSYNLHDADTIMIFAIPRTMPVLGTKIQRECKPGTYVLAYRFGIPLSFENKDILTRDTVPIDHDHNIRLHADLIYDQEEMRIYRTKGKVTVR